MKNVCSYLTHLYHWRIGVLICLFQGIMYSQAQESYNLTGSVTNEANGEPIASATIRFTGTNVGVLTNIDGNYEITTSLSSGRYEIRVSSIGYATLTREIELGNETTINLDFALREDFLKLDEVVITGASVATSKKQLGNSISTVDVSEIENSGARSIDQALAGKITGAQVTQNSGNPAGGISVRLRGPSTIVGSSDPLYIVDGVIVNNDSPELIDLGGYAQNRLVDINPEDIERIEVIKGASAAAIYGSRASNGVVQIFTKRGSRGKPKITFKTSFSINELRKKIDYNEVPLAWEDPFDRNNLNTVPAERFDLQEEFFDTGIGTENFLSITGGNANTQYYASGSYFYNEGIIKNSDFERFNGRLRIDQFINDWASVSFGASYSFSESAEIPNGGINSSYGAITGFLFSDNSINPFPNESGVFPVTSPLVARTNPLEAVNRFDFGQQTSRFIGDIQLNLTPLEGLKIGVIFGLDTYSQSGDAFIPNGNTSSQVTGFARRADASVLQINTDLNISYQKNITDNIQSTTSAGGTVQYDRNRNVAISVDRLNANVQTVNGGTVTGAGEFRSERSIQGAFIQQTFGLWDKLFITGAGRIDGSSVFGEDERIQFFPKASASYVLSEERFWQESGLSNTVNSLKFRASWGQAGNLTALGPFDRFTNYNPVALNGQPGLVPSTLLGNPDLKPERQTEVEIGVDFALFDSRIGVEFTYYEMDVEDLLLNRVLAPSNGFSSRFENVGSMTNKGIEILFKAIPVQTDNLQWTLTTTFSDNNNEVTEIIGERIILAGSFGTNAVIPEEPLGVFFRQFYARNEDGSILIDANGYPSRGTTPEGESSKVIGDPNPEWIGSVINEVKYRNFSFRIQFDAVQGFDVFNWNRRLLDNVIFGGGSDVGEELLGNLPKGLGGAEAGIFEEFIEDGSFVKLREVSLGYTITPNLPAINSIRLNFVGRNLVSFDDYSGWDPEINATGQSNGVRGFDFAEVPIPRTYRLGLTLTF